MNWQEHLRQLVASVIFGAVGVVVFLVALKLIVKISPFSIQKEIAEDQNVALGLVVGSIFIGLAIILSAAIQG
jgi:putative membrane protein